MIETTHGRIAYTDSGGGGTAVLLIHGNSACKEVFDRQVESPLATRYRLIALDLPGHGQSQDATDPMQTYSFAGYGDTVVQLAAQLRLRNPIVVGWSLGGHIAIELLRTDLDPRGILLTGTPPVGAADLEQGFLPHPHMALTGKREFTEADIAAYAAETTTTAPPWLEAAVRRTDGRAREYMLQTAMAANAPNQRLQIEATSVPTAVVTGTDEPFVNNDYLDGVAWGNLWERRVHRIDGCGHAPFLEQPAVFNPLLDRFIASLSTS
ncbi:MAG: alpha/beta hydrolase [Gammaproteobacteria bacterium]|nr:alpha/beta hydrolase [Gammaproteobacteria bacterium]